MKLQESGEMYLETILILSKCGKPVRSIDVAGSMEFSKPSVSRAMSILKTGEFIEIDNNGYITLTETGRKIAERTYERHQILTAIFKKLGVSEETAVNDACKIEHDLSDETFAAIKNHIKDFQI